MIEDEHFSAEDADAMAARWVVRLECASPDEADWLAFHAWLAADSAHGAAYDRVLALSIEIDRCAAGLLRELPAPASVAARRPLGRRWRVWAPAAAAAAAVAAIFLLPHRVAGPSPFTLYSSDVGEHRTLTLEDGTRVDMDGGSKISVRFDKDARRVTMGEAEAVFDVTKDPDRPFLITVGDRTVRVVGTEFDVRHRLGQVAVTVRRGVVEVAPADGARGEAIARLTPGKRLDHRVGTVVSTVVSASPDEVFSWRSGRLIYRDRPLSEVVADLNANFRRPITLADRRAAEVRFSGVLVLDNEDAVVKRLAAFAPLSSQTTRDGVVLRWGGPSRD